MGRRAIQSLSARPIWIGVVGFLAVLTRTPLFGSAQIWPDSNLYLGIAQDVVTGNGFGDGGGIWGAGYRTPGYPALLAFLKWAGADPSTAAVAFQQMLGVVFAVAVLLVAWHYFGRAAGIISGLIAGTTPMWIVDEHSVLPDALFSMVILAGAVVCVEALLRYRRSDRLPWGWLIAAGATFAAAAYLKPNGQILIAVLPIAAAIALRNWTKTWRSSLVVLVTMLVALAPWIVRNAVEYGQPVLSTQGGPSLWVKAFDVDHLPIPGDTNPARVARAAYRQTQAKARPDGLFLSYANVYRALLGAGLTADAAGSAMGSMALDAITAAPWTYALGAIKGVGTHLLLGGDGAKALDRVTPWLQKGPVTPVAVQVWKLSDVAILVWQILTLGGLLGLVLLFVGSTASRIAAAVFATTWLVMAGGTSLTNMVDFRYAITIAPFAWMLGSAGLATVIRLARRRSAKPPQADLGVRSLERTETGVK